MSMVCVSFLVMLTMRLGLRKQGLDSGQYNEFKVYLLEVPYTIIVQGVCNHSIGKYAGFYTQFCSKP